MPISFVQLTRDDDQRQKAMKIYLFINYTINQQCKNLQINWESLGQDNIVVGPKRTWHKNKTAGLNLFFSFHDQIFCTVFCIFRRRSSRDRYFVASFLSGRITWFLYPNQSSRQIITDLTSCLLPVNYTCISACDV